jgi:hypothetical protein
MMYARLQLRRRQVPTTVYDAQDHDIWPDPAGRPPPELREEFDELRRLR